jgi:hypothetical protein
LSNHHGNISTIVALSTLDVLEDVEVGIVLVRHIMANLLVCQALFSERDDTDLTQIVLQLYSGIRADSTVNNQPKHGSSYGHCDPFDIACHYNFCKVPWNNILEQTVVDVCLLLHRGRVGQAGLDVNTHESTLFEQVLPIATTATINLEQDTLPWCVLKVGEEGNNAIVNIALKLLVVNASFLIHPNGAWPFPLLLTSKPATCVQHVVQKLEAKPLPFFCCHAQR